jgi:hypothetical protein
MTNGELKQRIAIVRKRLEEGKEPKVSSGFMLALMDAFEAVTDERDVAQGLLDATSEALDVMRQTAELAARPAAVIIKRLAECEGEKYAVTAERDTLQAWLKSAPLDAIVVLSDLVDHPYSGSSLARVAHEWASNKDMNRYAANLRKVVETQVTP